MIVAIDGPSGSGKSTIGRRVASDLGLAYLDTGAMYRAVAWWALQRQVSLTDEEAVAEVARSIDLEIGTDPASPRFEVDGTDVSAAIRTSEISTVVSDVATNLQVRAELRRRQREVIEASLRHGGIVAEGRDITTVVAPDADVRLLLVADEEARLRRRATQLHEGRADGGDIDVESVRDQVLRRDADDSTVADFQRAADGVYTVDSSTMTLEDTVEVVRRLVQGTVTQG